MKKLLITAFEPFGGRSENVSLGTLTALPDVCGDFEITKLRLPVEFGRAGEILIREAEKLSADAVIALGEAGGRDAVTPELIAANVRNARIPDNAGYRPENEKCYEDGRDVYYSTLPVRAMAEAICSVGIPAHISFSAGTYVCNDVFYLMQHRFSGTGILTGFIHLPVVETLDAATLARAVIAAIEVLS